MRKQIKKLLKKQGFTLVELIIVIAIIAVLAVAAFMMLTKWLGKSRDSRRLGDMATIKKALEVTYSDTDRGLNMYPDPTDSVDILDGSGVVMWNQGVFGLDTIGEMDNMQKAPQDPGDDSYYRYAVTLDKKEFQLGTILEDGSDISMIGSVLAANGQARIDGNYDGYVSYPTTGGTMIFKTPSLLVKGEAKIEVFSGTVENLMLNGEEEGTPIVLRSVKTDENTSAEQLATALDIDEKSAAQVLKKETGAVVNVEKPSEEGEEPSSEPQSLITQEDCESAGWMWVGPENDMYIGTSQGDGFCISPRYGDWNDGNTGNGGISFNGWGNNSSLAWYNGWNSDSIEDSGNIDDYGQTRILESEVPYGCKPLGTASSDYDTEDTLVGRMKWIATTGDTYTEARSIDWITGLVPHTSGTYPQAIPALYIADCIDGVKDLTKTMTYTHNTGGSEEITYSEYTTDITDDTNITYNVTFQNRQKYLIAWTQKRGSHLPGAMSYISNGYGSAADSDGENLAGVDRGEYQLACEAELLTDGSDASAGEWIWLAAIGNGAGAAATKGGRVSNLSCSSRTAYGTGHRYGQQSARFVIRP